MIKQQPIRFDDFTFRCSSLGYIMTNPKGKSNKEKYDDTVKKLGDLTLKEIDTKNKETKTYQNLIAKIAEAKLEIARLEKIKDNVELSDTCKNHLIKIYIERKTGRRDEIFNRYLKKGIGVEDTAIKMLEEVNNGFYDKNKERKFNDYINGEIDVDDEPEDTIIDAKSSWDIFTFMPKTLIGRTARDNGDDFVDVDNSDEVDAVYYWQAQGYMELWNRSLYRLAYVLVDTPEGIIEDECKRFLYSLGSNRAGSREYQDGCSEIRNNSMYADLSVQEKVIQIPFKRDMDAYNKIVERVIQCRKWLNEYAISEFNRVNGKPESEVQETINIIEKAEPKVITVTAGFKIDEVNVSMEIEEEEIEIEDDIDENHANSENEIQEEETIEEEAVDFNAIYLTIKSTKNLGELTKLRKEYNDLGYIEQYEGVRESFAIQEAQLLKEFETTKKAEAVVEKPESINEKHQEIKNDNSPFVPSGNVLVDCMTRISKCQTEKDCIDLYKEIKQHFEEYPILKDNISEKRNSLKPKAVEEKPKEQPKSPEEKAQKPATKTSAEDSDEIKTLFAKADECKIADEIVELYKANRSLVDSNKKLKQHMQARGEYLTDNPPASEEDIEIEM